VGAELKHPHGRRPSGCGRLTWRNDRTGQPVVRSLLAYDPNTSSLGIDDLGRRYMHASS
jgi:hypothetical protein